MANKRYKKLLVIAKRKGGQCRVRCDCGNEFNVRRCDLTRGRVGCCKDCEWDTRDNNYRAFNQLYTVKL